MLANSPKKIKEIKTQLIKNKKVSNFIKKAMKTIRNKIRGISRCIGAIGAATSSLIYGQQLGFGINYTGTLPNINAALDIDITGAPSYLGLLIPRVSLNSNTDKANFADPNNMQHHYLFITQVVDYLQAFTTGMARSGDSS